MYAVNNDERDKLYAPELYPQVVAGMKKMYKDKLRPLEEMYKFDEFHSPLLRDCDFDAKPMVLLLGQYSTGKTTFIEHILERNFPGQRVGPEPTTDRFIAVMHGEDDRILPGNAVAVDADKPFHALNKFGTGFLSKFEASECNASILEHVTFVDTPGVLSGEKQRIGRSYDFVEVCEWFAERADLILLLFDAHKLDISDEFKRTIEILKGQDDKIRVVLNKADMVSPQQLMRVYGALMWALGKVVKTPEVMRVYIGSFWNKPYQNDDNRKLFDAERADLMRDLRQLPRNSAVRKINELVKRSRSAKVHALLLSHFKKKMPAMWGGKSKQEELIKNLLNEFKEVKRQNRLPPGDFPDIKKFEQQLKDYDFYTFAKANPAMFAKIDELLSVDIPRLMQQISPLQQLEVTSNPFAEPGPDDWMIIPEEKEEFDALFLTLNPINGKVTGASCKQIFLDSGVGSALLRKIWDLSDMDKDGKLDCYEFAIAMYLTRQAKQSGQVPELLPVGLVPPQKRAEMEALAAVAKGKPI